MTHEDVIRDVKDKASEWLEMADSPEDLLAHILAQKVVYLTQHIEYLEKRLHHAIRNH